MICFAKNSIRTHLNENNPIYCFTYIYKIPKKIKEIQLEYNTNTTRSFDGGLKQEYV